MSYTKQNITQHTDSFKFTFTSNAPTPISTNLLLLFLAFMFNSVTVGLFSVSVSIYSLSLSLFIIIILYYQFQFHLYINNPLNCLLIQLYLNFYHGSFKQPFPLPPRWQSRSRNTGVSRKYHSKTVLFASTKPPVNRKEKKGVGLKPHGRSKGETSLQKPIRNNEDDSECENEECNSPWRNRRPSPGKWIEPVESYVVVA